MRPNLPKDIITLAAELIKHQAKKQLGDGFIDVLSSRLVDYAGDNALEKVNEWLESGENAEKVLAAFKDADKAFHNQGDDTFKQMIVSKPLSQLDTLENLAKALPNTLDDDGLVETLLHQFESDWSNLSSHVHEKAARAYRVHLERSLAIRCNQLLPSIFTKVERIEANTEKILDKLDFFKPSQPTSISNWYLPFPRNEKFVGREDDLERLHKALQQGESVGVRPAMLSGMGGIGKTQLAAEYAYRYKEQYPGGIYWVNTAQDLLIKGMAETAEKIGLRPTSDVPESQRLTWLANAFAKHLSSHQSTLVIFDNVEDPKILRLPAASFIPTELKCHILFTTRRRDIDKTFYLSFEVTVLPENAAMQLLLRHPSRQSILDPKHNDHAVARIICMTLGFLPLAIELAGAYLGKYEEIPLWDYRVRLLDEGAMETVDDTELRPEDMPTRHDTGINATLKLSWEAIQDDTDAQLALKAAGQLREAELISIHLLSLLTGIEAISSAGKPTKLSRALKRLYEFSLVEKLTIESLRLHPLVFNFASRLAEDGFRVALADRLAHALCKVDFLIPMIQIYGFDLVLSDTQVGLWLYGSENNKLKNELYTLNLLMDNERHVLRNWKPNKQSTFPTTFPIQQLYNRALIRATKDWQDRFHKYLDSKWLPWLEEKHIFSRISPAFLRTFEGHTKSVNSVVITPDGTQAISASSDNSLRLWDLESGEGLRTFNGHTGPVNSVALTLDGRRAISASDDNSLRLWDLESGKCLRTYEGSTGRVTSVAITPDGTQAISASDDNSLRQWDLKNGKCWRTFKGYTGRVTSVAITPDGTQAISTSTDNTMCLVWDLRSGKSLGTFRHTGSVYRVAITSDGKRALSASDVMSLHLWDLKSGKCLVTFKGHTFNKDHTYRLTSVAITPDGRRAISASMDNSMYVWDLESGERLHTFEGHTSWVTSVAITPDGRRAISASKDNSLRLWDLEGGEGLQTFEGHTKSVNSVVITPDGTQAISVSIEETQRLWDLKSGKSQILGTSRSWVTSVVITPDGTRVISASRSGSLTMSDLKTIMDLHDYKGHTGRVYSVAITPDGKRAISASEDKSLRLWDLKSGWDLESGKSLRTFEGHTGRVYSVTITPDGKRAISASDDKSLRLWDLESGAQLRTFEGHTGSVNSVAISPNGLRAISASDDKSLRLWDLTSGSCLLLLNSEAPFYSVAITSNGKLILAGDSAGAVHFIAIHNFK